MRWNPIGVDYLINFNGTKFVKLELRPFEIFIIFTLLARYLENNFS